MTAQQEVAGGKRNRATVRRRRQILDAAVLCFLENGYHQTGVRDIAARAGVSLGNLYNHFPGKHDMLAEIARLERNELEPFLEILGQTAPAVEVLETFIEAYVRYLAVPANMILVIEITGEAIRKPDIAELFQSNWDTLSSAVASVMCRGCAEGDLRAVPDPSGTAQMILELLEGAAARNLLNGTPVCKVTDSAREFVMAAVASRPG